MDEVIDSSQLTVYQIRVKGHLGAEWRDWFEGLSITLEECGDTLLTGPVVDQAALHGLLKKVRDLGTPLVSVNQMEPVPADAEHAKQEMNHQIKGGSPVFNGIVSPAVALLAGGTICLANRTAATSGGVSRQFPESLKGKSEETYESTNWDSD